MPPETSGLSEEDYLSIRENYMKATVRSFVKEEAPVAIFTGGLLGLGKSTMVEEVLSDFANLVVDADSMRNLHPRYLEWLGELGSEPARSNTREFCDRMAVDVQNEVLTLGRGFIREGTLQLPVECPVQIRESFETGYNIMIVVLAGQKGDEELGRYLRHWEMRYAVDLLAQTDPALARIAYIREIEHTYNDAEAQAGILQALDKIEDDLARDMKNNPGRNHKILVVGQDQSIKYFNGFSGTAIMTASAICDQEYKRARSGAEAAEILRRFSRCADLMRVLSASESEWQDFLAVPQRRFDGDLLEAMDNYLARQDAMPDPTLHNYDHRAAWAGIRSELHSRLLGKSQ